jgi:hypothetical protein
MQLREEHPVCRERIGFPPLGKFRATAVGGPTGVPRDVKTSRPAVSLNTGSIAETRLRSTMVRRSARVGRRQLTHTAKPPAGPNAEHQPFKTSGQSSVVGSQVQVHVESTR